MNCVELSRRGKVVELPTAKSVIGFHSLVSLVLFVGCCWLVLIDDVCVCPSCCTPPARRARRSRHACLLQPLDGAGLTVGSASFGSGMQQERAADKPKPLPVGGTLHSTLCIERSSEVRHLPRFLKAIDRTERTTNASYEINNDWDTSPGA